MNRRSFAALGLSGIIATSDWTRRNPTPIVAVDEKSPFRFCLNTSTIRGQNLSILEEVKIAAEAGYSGIEPWIGKIRKFVDQGGNIRNLKSQIADLGLTIESAIGFANWIVDDDTAREKALVVARKDMELVAELGGKRIAAPPAGGKGEVDLDSAADRYRRLLELGAEVGVVPQLELWGHSQAINRLGELFYIASETGREDACLLPDVYHIYKGGSDFRGLKMFNGGQMHVFHLNDYPADLARDKINDSDRVYPGDGVAPMSFILKTLFETGFRGALSLELFNRDLWEQDPLEVAKTGLAKMKACVTNAELDTL
jgi:2-keto-myo-inositol isomerase